MATTKRQHEIPFNPPTPIKVYASVEHYYGDVPKARHSGESDFGVWWKDETGATWRISWVHETGDIYAARLGYASVATPEWLGGGVVVATGDNEGPCMILGRFPVAPKRDSFDDPHFVKFERQVVEPLFEGWAEMCGKPNSLFWIAERAARAGR